MIRQEVGKAGTWSGPPSLAARPSSSLCVCVLLLSSSRVSADLWSAQSSSLRSCAPISVATANAEKGGEEPVALSIARPSSSPSPAARRWRRRGHPSLPPSGHFLRRDLRSKCQSQRAAAVRTSSLAPPGFSSAPGLISSASLGSPQAPGGPVSCL